ncbi:hypothetical protein SEUCBS140593_000790 [Sporothrix eucalyptigena]|uniref:Zn(2)-C6 fungal-type domain-containing protein n=1 Tax=Sporothrix eucalyptigena TaxID=1812306 RepID=A0ABP0ASQ9_9PEZI
MTRNSGGGLPITVFDINHIQVDPKTFTKKRKRTNTACVRCHERKIKCDAGSLPNNTPCRNCVSAGTSCVMHVDGRTRAGPIQVILDTNEGTAGNDDDEGDSGGCGGTSSSIDASDTTHSASQVVSHASHSTRALSPPPPPRTLPPPSAAASVLLLPRLPSPAPRAAADTSVQRFEAYIQDNLGSYAPSFRPSQSGSGHDADTSKTANTSASDAAIAAAVLSSFTPSATHDSYSQSGSDPFLGAAGPAHVNPNGGGSNYSLDSTVYNGNNHNQHTPVSYTAAGAGPATTATATNAVGGERVEVEMGTRATLDWEREVTDLDAADVDYLRAKGAFDLPSADLQADLIDAFFSDVHPTSPVVNRWEFLADFRAGRRQSRLLLFAIFTAAARACRNPALLDAKGTNHASAWRFYRATKALLDTGYERSRLVVVQALLLITWWWDKKDDGGRNMRSCAVDAINTAQSIGMHRWDQYPKQPGQHGNRDKGKGFGKAELGLWKRIWWSCVNRDVGVAVAHGLPCMLSLDDSDVHPLTPHDFNEDPSGAAGGQWASYSEAEVLFMIEQTRVAEALRHIHNQYFVQQKLQLRLTGSIAAREEQLMLGPSVPAPHSGGLKPDNYNDAGLRLCREWLANVPAAVQYDVDDVQGHRFWPAFLHILYYSNIMLRFREVSVSRPATPRAVAEHQYGKARGIAAATMVSKIIRNMRAHGHLLRCTGQLTNSLFNCLLFFLIEGHIAGASNNTAVRDDARRKYTLCLNQLYEFSQLWISASLVHRLFEALQASLFQPNPRASASTSTIAGYDQGHELFPGFRTSSDITQSYMRQLVETEFYHPEPLTAIGVQNQTQPTGESLNAWALPSPDDVWSGLDQPMFGGLPATLDVDTW